jgi:hypothetical protein
MQILTEHTAGRFLLGFKPLGSPLDKEYEGFLKYGPQNHGFSHWSSANDLGDNLGSFTLGTPLLVYTHSYHSSKRLPLFSHRRSGSAPSKCFFRPCSTAGGGGNESMCEIKRVRYAVHLGMTFKYVQMANIYTYILYICVCDYICIYTYMHVHCVYYIYAETLVKSIKHITHHILYRMTDCCS